MLYPICIIFLSTFISTSVFSKTHSLQSAKSLVAGYQNLIGKQKNKNNRIKYINQFKRALIKAQPLKTDSKAFHYLHRVRSSVMKVADVKPQGLTCESAKDIILFEFGYPPKTKLSKTNLGIQEGLKTLKLICPKLKI